MKCQIAGCRCKNAKPISKKGIFCGVNVENITIYSCGKHTKNEIEIALELAGEKEASFTQEVNPFQEVKKSRKF